MKSKKILTILLSLAIMFTFMPAMAFAALPDGTSEQWADDGSKYTVTVNGTSQDFETVRTWSAGVITASIKPSTKDTSEMNAREKVAYGVTSGGTLTYQYVDLDASKVVWKANKTVTEVSYANAVDETGTVPKIKQANFDVLLTVPEYATNYDAKTATTTAAVLLSTVAETKATTVFSSADIVYGADYTQNATVAAIVRPDNANVATDKNYSGSIAPTVFTISGVKAWTFAIDSLTVPTATMTGTPGNYAATFAYDGAAHTLVSNNVAGKKVEFALLDPTTNKYVDATTVSVKDVLRDAAGTVTAYSVKYKVLDTETNTYDVITGTSKEGFIAITVNPVTNYSFVWNVGNANVNKDDLVDVGEGADPLDYIKANVKSADKEEAMKLFADKYEITATPSKADSTRVTWAINAKSGVDAAALAKTYKTFLSNYGGTDGTVDGAHVEVRIGSNNKDDDITFSGVTTKSFKAKKKTKKLAKAKSFQIAAVADSGNEITFTATTTNSKIKVSKTGKVTVKKGLKKGTYKVTVKAKTAAGNGYKAAKESKVYTIKIK